MIARYHNTRRFAKLIPRNHGYSPDLQDAPVQNALQQAEALSAVLTQG